jgi:hypothetical protein
MILAWASQALFDICAVTLLAILLWRTRWPR